MEVIVPESFGGREVGISLCFPIIFKESSASPTLFGLEFLKIKKKNQALTFSPGGKFH